MKITLAQLNPIPADIKYNKSKIFEVLNNAQKDELVIFPELFIYGHHNFDMIKKFPFILSQIDEVIEEIKENYKNPILISYPTLLNGKIQKTHQLINGENLDIEIIDDKELMDENYVARASYVICLKSFLSRTNAEYLRNCTFEKFIKKQNKNLIFINQVGAIDEFIYDGASRMYDKTGKIVALAKVFEEDVLKIENNIGRIEKVFENFKKPMNLDKFSLDYETDLERTYRAIILSIKDYFSKNGFKQAVLGLSGGLDSTICAVLLADALGAKNVLGVSMPSKLTSNLSKTDAYELAKNLGIGFFEAPIKKYHDAFSDGFEEIFDETSKHWCNKYTNSYTQDNIQARSRAMILWGIANEYGSTLSIATSDKSEAHMGYATINGDMSGGFAPIADVTKTKLFALARWMNKNREVKNAIPESIILKPPGAELAIDPNTGETLKAEDALMPYEFLDEVIWRIENLHQSVDNMMKSEFLYEKNNKITLETKKLWLEKFFKRLNTAIYKWYILPPAPIVDSFSINKAEFSQPIVSNINHLK